MQSSLVFIAAYTGRRPSRSVRHRGTIRRVELRDPDVSLGDAFRRMAEDFRSAGEARYREACSYDGGELASYVARLEAAARGEGMVRGQVPERTYWAIVGGEVAGVSRLRPRLDPFHERLAGHVGFDLAPAHRKPDVAERLLALTFAKARDLALSELLLCCDPENDFRRKAIEGAGGTFLDEVSGLIPEGDAYRKVRYRVTL